MSKSAESDLSRINLLDSPDTIRNKVKRAKSDEYEGLEFDNPSRPEANNLLTIYSLMTGSSKVCPWLQSKPVTLACSTLEGAAAAQAVQWVINSKAAVCKCMQLPSAAYFTWLNSNWLSLWPIFLLQHSCCSNSQPICSAWAVVETYHRHAVLLQHLYMLLPRSAPLQRLPALQLQPKYLVPLSRRRWQRSVQTCAGATSSRAWRTA